MFNVDVYSPLYPWSERICLPCVVPIVGLAEGRNVAVRRCGLMFFTEGARTHVLSRWTERRERLLADVRAELAVS